MNIVDTFLLMFQHTEVLILGGSFLSLMYLFLGIGIYDKNKEDGLGYIMDSGILACIAFVMYKMLMDSENKYWLKMMLEMPILWISFFVFAVLVCSIVVIVKRRNLTKE